MVAFGRLRRRARQAEQLQHLFFLSSLYSASLRPACAFVLDRLSPSGLPCMVLGRKTSNEAARWTRLEKDSTHTGDSGLHGSARRLRRAWSLFFGDGMSVILLAAPFESERSTGHRVSRRHNHPQPRRIASPRGACTYTHGASNAGLVVADRLTRKNSYFLPSSPFPILSPFGDA